MYIRIFFVFLHTRKRERVSELITSMVKSYKVDFHISNKLELGKLGRIHVFSDDVELTLEMKNRLGFFLVKLQEGENTFFKTCDMVGGFITDGVLRIIDENHIGVTWNNHLDHTSKNIVYYDEVVIDTPYMRCNYDILIDDYYENHVKGVY